MRRLDTALPWHAFSALPSAHFKKPACERYEPRLPEEFAPCSESGKKLFYIDNLREQTDAA
jgi:hypothetical protein